MMIRSLLLCSLIFSLIHPLFAENASKNQPTSAVYQHQQLEKAISQYEQLAASGGWTTVPAGPALKEGDNNLRVTQLKERLRVSGEFSSEGIKSSLFTSELTSAVKLFQERHGLAVDGVVGRYTLEALNVPITERIRTLRVNAERSRKFDPYLGSYFLFVNIAGFEVVLVKEGAVMLRSNVVVGKPFHQTPSFEDEVRYVEFYPAWHVPRSILRNEMVPALKRDANYIAAQHLELYRQDGGKNVRVDPRTMNWNTISRYEISKLNIRQRPGSWNALGLVKFGFPNTYDVYLHDTPARSLFQEPSRAFSHGCIRVEKAAELAEMLLIEDNPEWNSDRVRAAFMAGTNKKVPLRTPVPISITYRTAWIDLDGSLHFRRDIYKRD